MEVFEEVRSKMQQAGLSLRNRDWSAVQLLAQEVSDRCWQASARWGDHLARSARNNLTDAAQIAESVVSFAAESSVQQLDGQELRQAFDAQRRASNLISIALGEAQKAEERSKR